MGGVPDEKLEAANKPCRRPHLPPPLHYPVNDDPPVASQGFDVLEEKNDGVPSVIGGGLADVRISRSVIGIELRGRGLEIEMGSDVPGVIEELEAGVAGLVGVADAPFKRDLAGVQALLVQEIEIANLFPGCRLGCLPDPQALIGAGKDDDLRSLVRPAVAVEPPGRDVGIGPLAGDRAGREAVEILVDLEAGPRSPVQKVIGSLIIFLFNTGLRKSEALNLRWQNLRDTNIDVLGKGKKWRKVPLNATAQRIIARQPRVSAYVFDIPNRHQMGLFRHTILQIRKKSRVPCFHLHLCRHWFTVALLRAGVDIKTVGDILGHSRIVMSLIYAHSSPDSRQQAVDAIDTKHGHGTLSQQRPNPEQVN